MATVKHQASEALGELGITEWVMRGDPQNEAEFKEMFRKITGADANGSGTDWTALSDVTMTDNMKTYRQKLRDLPAHNDGKDAALDDTGALKNVTWPQKPA